MNGSLKHQNTHICKIVHTSILLEQYDFTYPSHENIFSETFCFLQKILFTNVPQLRA